MLDLALALSGLQRRSSPVLRGPFSFGSFRFGWLLTSHFESERKAELILWSVGGVISASEQSERTEGIQTVVVQVYCRLSGSFHIQFHTTGVAPTLRFGHRPIDGAASIGAVPSLHLCHAKRHTLSRSDACCDITTSQERHSARAGFMGCYFRSDDRCIGP
jgi:hypothetical protein